MRLDRCVVQFNLRRNPAFLLDNIPSPFAVNHTFLCFRPRDKELLKRVCNEKAGLSSILIAVVLLALGVTAEAQQAKIPPIGYLSSFDPASDCDGTEAIRLALRELGYIEGQLDALR